MQIPRTLDRLDLAGFSIWLRRYGTTIFKTEPLSACVISFEVTTKKGKGSRGSIWTYGGDIEYVGAAMLNYASYMMRGRPMLDPKNTYETVNSISPILYDGRGGSFLRKKRTFRQKILARDGNLCFYCGYEMAHGDITLEHLIPRSAGGKTSPENIVLAHAFCNNRAGILCYEDKLALRGTIRPPHIAWQENRNGYAAELCRSPQDVSGAESGEDIEVRGLDAA